MQRTKDNINDQACYRAGIKMGTIGHQINSFVNQFDFAKNENDFHVVDCDEVK